jgi:hypothetical protein
LEKHGVSLLELTEEESGHMAEEFTIDKVKKAISSAKASSAPGPTGQTIALYKYIFSVIPQTLTKALNQMTFVPGLIESPTFVWLKKRRIVFIPKTGREGDTISNLRPLSLLETMYKIKTRIFTERMAGIMELILYRNQHGFCRNRSTYTNSITSHTRGNT